MSEEEANRREAALAPSRRTRSLLSNGLEQSANYKVFRFLDKNCQYH